MIKSIIRLILWDLELIEMFLILFICWIIFNGNLTLEIALVGIAMSALVYLFMAKFLNWSFKKDILLAKFTWFAISYFAILVIEIVKATIATIGITFDERVEVQPVLVTFDTDIESNVLRVLLANSITMTPGTITVSLEDNHYTVHALDESFGVDLDESIFVQKLRKADALAKQFKAKEGV